MDATNPCAGCGLAEGRPSLCCHEFLIATPPHAERPQEADLGYIHFYLMRGHRLGWEVRTLFPRKHPDRLLRNWEVAVPFPCPSLQPDGRCGAYAQRPSVCREYPPFPSVVEGKPQLHVSGCERYDPPPPPSFVFRHPGALLRTLERWFGYDPERERRRFVPVAQAAAPPQS